MSNLNKRILSFFMIVAVAFGLVACTNPDNSVRIRFNTEEIEVRQNETKVLEPTIIKSSQVENVDLVFTSSDESVVKVENGVLVPVAMGEATVKVAWAKKDIIFDKVVVKVVKASLPIPTIAYDAKMLKGATQTVSVNLGELNLTEATYSFVALNPEVATISEEGVITAVAVGTAKFEVVVADYEESEKYEIEVQVEESDFAIKYELNGGTNHAENPVGYSALKLPLPLKEATKVGYEFLGWYEGEQKVTEIAAGRLGDVELEAKWEAVEYNITFEGLEGATVAELPAEYTIESAEIVLPVPTKAGYNFLGYFDGEVRVEKIATGSYGDVELEAKWETAEYAISYDTAGGELVGVDVQTLVEQLLAEYNAVCGTNHTKDNFHSSSGTSIKTFFGSTEQLTKYHWLIEFIYEDFKAYNESSINTWPVPYVIQGLELILAGDTSAIVNASPYGPDFRTMVRHYMHSMFNLSRININGTYYKHTPDFADADRQQALLDASGRGAKYATSYTIEEEVSLPTPEREGYEFLGWYIGDEKVEKIAKGSVGDKALVAKWEVIQYKVSYDTAQGELKSFSSHEEIVAEFIKDFAAYSKETITTPAAYWKSGSKTSFWRNAEMHAKWSWIFEYLTPLAKKQGQEVTYLQNMLLDTPTISGYATQNVAIFLLQINNNIWNETYKAQYNGLSSRYTTVDCTGVTFDSYKSYLPEQFPIIDNDFTCEEELVLPTPTRHGYEFAGWYVGEQRVEKIEKGTIGDVTLVAHWNAVEYTIEYVLDGGVNAEGNPTKYTIESETITLAAPAKEGYIFKGWSNDGKIEKGSTGNKTFTAEWEKIIVYTISWDLDGGSWTTQAGVESYEKGSVVELPTPERYQHTFLGWYEGETKVEVIADKDYVLVAKWENVTISTDELSIEYELAGGNWQEGQVPDADHPLAETMGYVPVKEGFVFAGWHTATNNEVNPPKVILTAKWKVAVEYTISYNLNGGTNGANPTKYSEYSETIVLAPATKAGYEFLGWFNAQDQEVKEIAKGSNGDVVLTAKWAVEEYEINYNLDGGVNAESNPTSYTIEDEEIVLAAATKAGHAFLGWYDSEDNKVEKIAKGSTGNVELVAKWESLQGSISYDLAGGEWEFTPYTTHEEIKNAFIADFEAFINEGLPEDKWTTISLTEDAEPKKDSSGAYKTYQTDFFGRSYNKDVNGFFTKNAAKWGWLLDYVKAESASQDLTNASVLRACIHNFIYASVRKAAVNPETGDAISGWPAGQDFTGVTYETYKSKVPATLGSQFTPETEYVPGTPFELPVPVKEGFEFGGWLLEGKPFKFTAETSGDLALVAKWLAPVVAEDMAVTDADAVALNALEVAPTIVVNPVATEGTYKLVNANLAKEYGYYAYELGVNLFADIAAALEKAQAGDVIYVMAGTYTQELVISVEDLTLVGPNYNVHGHATRAAEANVDGRVYVYGNGLTVNGLRFAENGSISVSANDVTLSNVVVEANQVACVGNNRKAQIVNGYESAAVKAEEEAAGTKINESIKFAKVANFTLKDSYVNAPGEFNSYVNLYIAFTYVQNLTISGNYITNQATTVTGSSNYASMRFYTLSGELNVLNNEFRWATDGYVMVIGGYSACTEINFVGNTFDGNANVAHTATLSFGTSTADINIENNKFNNFKGTTFSFNAAAASKVVVKNNVFDANTAFKINNINSNAYTFEGNTYAGGMSSTNKVTPTDYNA